MGESQWLQESELLAEQIVAWRRDFHRFPELGFQEHRTSRVIAEEMAELGLSVQTNIAETGVIAQMDGSPSGPVVLFRVDMDALPIQEETGVSYASTHPGIMHACGHDGHCAVGIAVAHMLNAHRDELPGSVKFVFQPAEEGLGGAERMVAEGVLQDPTPDYSLSFHLWNAKPTGWIGITPGPVMAGAELLEIILSGQGGHGALPHQTIDPIPVAANVISALQTVISRNVHPLDSAVISITQITAGETFNVIPDRVILRGTIRTFLPEVRNTVLRRIEEISRGVATAMDCEAEVKIERLTPSVINDTTLAGRFRDLARRMFPEAAIETDEITMVSDDMAFMMETIPGCYLFVGSNDSSKGLDATHHNPCFNFDESALPRAAALMAASIWSLLEKR